ncbi:MAG: hypothetical protein ACE5JH_06480 [Acidobacteriota bacterium]
MTVPARGQPEDPRPPAAGAAARRALPALLLALGLLVVPALGPAPDCLAEEGSKGGASEEKRQAKEDGQRGERPPPALRFTDEDLEKYHRRPPPVDGGRAGERTAAPRSAGKRSPAPVGGTPPKGRETVIPRIPIERDPTRPHAPLVRTPMEIAKPPSSDPLKRFKDRDRREKFRAEQIRDLRDRIGVLESRLDYLRLKRLAVLDPLRIMPAPPPGYDAGGEGELKARELLAKVEAEIGQAESELATLRENLVEIETRFGRGADGR